MIRGEESVREPDRESVPPDRDGARAPVPGTASDECAGTSLRLQVFEIIDSLLNSTGPELEELRVRLRGHLRAHPWNPETALLHYLWDRELHLADPLVFGQEQGPSPSPSPALRPRIRPTTDQAGN